MPKTVLVVDDDPKSMKLSFDLLSAFGYRIFTATDGRQALEIARTQMPDLILMDIQLPVIDGIAATRALKADPFTRGIPVVAATAYAMKVDEDRAYSAGCDGYMTKPLDIQVLLRTVDQFLTPKTANTGIRQRSTRFEEQKT